ncbi:MAG TPA: DNA mismatch repair protein MutS [Erysipelotrichaceae bacterium]|nr:DNA mismatch repair protein MutS [Erysipelotrichaceae bacterium]
MKKYTPMIRQYLKIKEEHSDALIFYRLGDFYEMFFDDAIIASKALDIVLTARNSGAKDKIPMCGVPHHAASNYILRLTQKGYKVAIVEQLEDPADAVGIVKRGVVKIVTPGTVMDELNEDSESIYLAAVTDFKYGYGVAICEMASGKITVSQVDHDKTLLVEKLLSYNTKEVVVSENFDERVLKLLTNLPNTVISTEDSKDFNEYKHLYDHVENHNLVDTSQLMLAYLNRTQMKMLNHLRKVEVENIESYLKMDYASILNLELVESIKISNNQKSLWDFLNKTKTSMGARLLKTWITKPLVNKEEILSRQDMISVIKDDFLLRDNLKEDLNEIYDLERLSAKFAYGNANAIDAVRLKTSLAKIPKILNDLSTYPQFKDLCQVDSLSNLHDILDQALVDKPPVSLREGGLFKEGYNLDLDQMRKIQREGQNWILELEAKEREKTGVPTLKIGYNRVFGYFFEATKAHKHKLKEEDGYIRKQTLTNVERFITDELKAKEDEILNADDKSKNLEYSLFLNLVERVVTYMPKLLLLAQTIAQIDVLYALGEVATNSGYIKPKISKERDFEIIDGRHPILDQLMQDEKYVSNTLTLSDKDLWLITGPNMGGKSTFMRQVTLIVILAQMGAFVPARSATIPIFDQLFTRIGASDDILSGQSTFMVEMFEANNALQNATKNSLIIFDEIGRGTSTYDGMSLAKAMIEYIATNIKAKTLFSTHYHELVQLADNFDNIENYHVEVFEKDGDVTFLYKMIAGQADRSYGINVAKLAGLPESIIERSSEILVELEANKVVNSNQKVIVEKAVTPKHLKVVEDLLLNVDINELTPIAALQFLDDLKNKIK